MKGKGQKRRMRNALAAGSANLYQAQFGKASKWDALPEPPNREDDTKSLPRSTRKILALMRQQDGFKDGSHAQTALERSKDKFRNVVRLDPANQASEPTPTGGRTEDTEPSKPPESSQVSERKHNGTASALELRESLGLVPKGCKTKEKRKRVLRDKKRLKKLKRQVARMSGEGENGDEDVESKGADVIEFGEVAHAPPKATLKRRHWDEEQAAAAHRARHKEMFLKHIRSTGVTHVDFARERMQAQREEEVRRQVVDVYRTSKGGRTGGATLQSLRDLVSCRAV